MLLFGSVQKSLMLSLIMTCGKCWGKAWQQKDVNKVVLNLLCFSAHRNQLLWGFGDKSCIQVVIQSRHLSNVHSVIYFLNPFSWGWLSPQAVSEYHATLCHIKKDFLLLIIKTALDKFSGYSLVFMLWEIIRIMTHFICSIVHRSHRPLAYPPGYASPWNKES